jgi:steroid 5-alpha reductase family enzyme
VTRRRIAVIGSGVSGITAGYVLSRTDDVTLFEADSRLGGHSDTHLVVPPAGPPIGIDTGFIVYNERTYPLLTRMFAELDVATQPSEMSMSVRCAGCGLQYAGQRGPGGVAAGLRRGRGRYLRMLTEIPRFHRAARRLLASDACDDRTLGQFLQDGGFCSYFAAHFALPLVAAVWSCPPGTALSYPARYLCAFHTAWGIGLAVAALAALVSSAGHGQPERRYTLLAASLLWGLRLAAYVSWRNRGKGEDPRYRDLLSRARGNKNLYALRVIYLLQALILWLATIPVQAGMLGRAPAGALVVIGAVVWLGGFVFESVGDWQLARFKADPAHQGMIMDRGLWRYTRHPNYFGDFCMWWGLFLISLGSWVELLFVFAPLLMTYILTRGTGQRMTERRMTASRSQYADYVARTSGFIPRPPKRNAAGPAREGRA